MRTSVSAIALALGATLVLALIGCNSSSDNALVGASCPTSGVAPSGGSGGMGSPYVMSVGTSYSGSVGYFSSVYYRFQAPSSGHYTGCLAPTAADLQFQLYYDSAGNLGSSYADPCDDQWEGGHERCSTSSVGVPLTGGSYYWLEVFNWGPSADNYTMTATKD